MRFRIGFPALAVLSFGMAAGGIVLAQNIVPSSTKTIQPATCPTGSTSAIAPATFGPIWPLNFDVPPATQPAGTSPTGHLGNVVQPL